MRLKVGDVVTNEYGHTGKILEINYPDEVEMSVFNYGIEGDTDWCSLSGCKLATEEELLESFM